MSPDDSHEPFDLTRPNEYQGSLNRVHVAGQVANGVVILTLGIGFGILGHLVAAPWWFSVIAGLFVLLGILTIAYWYRAFRRGRPIP